MCTSPASLFRMEGFFSLYTPGPAKPQPWLCQALSLRRGFCVGGCCALLVDAPAAQTTNVMRTAVVLTWGSLPERCAPHPVGWLGVWVQVSSRVVNRR